MITESPRRVSRRDFLKFAGLVGGSLFVPVSLTGCESRTNSGNDIIEPGESKDLTYFRYSNQFNGYVISVNESILEARSNDVPFKLYTPQELKVSLTPDFDVEKPNIDNWSGVMVNKNDGNPSTITIAGEKIIVAYEQIYGRRPTTRAEEAYLSVAHSASLVFGHCQLQVEKGEISQDEALVRTDSYLKAVFDLEKAELPTWMYVVGNPPPDNFKIGKDIDRNQLALLVSRIAGL